MLNAKYPYQNFSLKNIKGEKWKDIPGFEDEYQLSNYARLKSLDRWIDKGNYYQFRPGRIIKQRLTSSAKRSTKVTVDLQMKLHKEKKRYQFSVARYVYYLFVEKFDFDDHTMIVSRKDGDKLNCYYKNLLLRSISEVSIEGFATQKRKSRFQLQSKPVTQYTLAGERVKRYANSKTANEATGISSQYINGSAKSAVRTAGGYFWRYGKSNPTINVSIQKRPTKTEHEGGNIPSIISKKYSYHYLNRNIQNIHGEKWKDIGGYLSMYQVSDHGRIKSLSRLKEMRTDTGNVASYWSREIIMKQNVIKYFSNFKGEFQHYLRINLKKEGIDKTFSVSTLVYLSFGKNKRTSTTKNMIHIDGDNLNNNISNLMLNAR